MDRLKELKDETKESRDLTLDTSSPPSESFITANESSSKFYSLSDVDSTFDVLPTKNSSISSAADPDETITESDLISNLSPIPKKIDNFKIGKQIEAANILSGGVNIFDDNDNSYDGDELVIDDNNLLDDEKNNTTKSENTELPLQKTDEIISHSESLSEAIASKDTEVVLQIDGKNVDAIAIGTGLYLYRKTGVEELAAVQIIDDDQLQPSFKFLKVRENSEGNLEVYEEIEVEVPKEVPEREGKLTEKKSHVPINDISKVINENFSNKCVDNIAPKIDNSVCDLPSDLNTDSQSDLKAEVNLNGKKVKINESRKSPLISMFTPMTIHSTPNKEGIPLTKTMVDQQLHPSRHMSDNIKKTIEVHTDVNKKEILLKNKETEVIKTDELQVSTDKEQLIHQNELSNFIINDSTDADNNINPKQSVDIDNMKKGHLINDTKCKLTTNTITDIPTITETDPTSVLCHDSKTNEHGQDNLEFKITSNKQLVHISELNIKVESDNIDLNQLINSKTKMLNSTEDEIHNKTRTDLILENQNVKDNNDNAESKQNINSDGSDSNIPIDSSKSNILDEEKEENIIEVPAQSPSINKIKDVTSEIGIDGGSQDPPLNSNIKDNNKHLKSDENISGDHLNKTSMQIDEGKTEVRIDTIYCNNLNSTIDNRLTISENTQPIESSEIGKSTCSKIELNVSAEEEKALSLINKVTHDKDLEIIKIESLSVCNATKNLKENADDPTKFLPKNCSNTNAKNIEHNDTLTNSSDDNASTLKPDISNEKKITCDNLLSVPKETETVKIAKPPLTKETLPRETKIQLPSIINKTETSKLKTPEVKASNNNSAVPFGKWTEANRQEFLNKIKETKIPTSNSNTKQLKQPNDLNRRDILKKIDTQRQAHQTIVKNNDCGTLNKPGIKIEIPAFVNKPVSTPKPIQPKKCVLPDAITYKTKPVINNKEPKDEIICKEKDETSNNMKKIPAQRKEINNQDLIDKTIEGIINRAVSTKPHEEWKQTIKMDAAETLKSHNSIVSLDAIESKMNELHGIPFVERPAHELPQVNFDNKTQKSNIKTPNIPQLSNKNKLPKKNARDNLTENISDEEIIEHEPITGDMSVSDQKSSMQSSLDKLSLEKNNVIANDSMKEPIITEKDFDKFARRNSITYENCLTVNFDGKESHNVIQTLVEKEVPCKKLTRNEMMLAESKAKSTSKLLLLRHNNNPNKVSTYNKNVNEEDSFNKNYQPQSKVQLAYQSALTAKRQLESPISIIEDKPVKVVFLDSSSEIIASNLNVQGQELVPSKKFVLDSDGQSASDSLDFEVLDTSYEIKSQEEIKSKSKHQRKQVLTPVDTSDLELIEPTDLGIVESPKRKRKFEEPKDNSTKNISPKKSYLLNRTVVEEKTGHKEISEVLTKETVTDTKVFVPHTDAISAIDNLVKAAELIETQSEIKGNTLNVQTLDSSLTTPPKRGRGRPRKYPVSETSPTNVNTTYLQKKSCVVDSNISKQTDESDPSDMDEEFIKENWTMGKINENIVCPICNKLFRSENVVFKHVKHCGPSPNRSDSDRRSLRQFSQSEEKSDDSDSESTDNDDIIIVKAKDSETKTMPEKNDTSLIKRVKEKPLNENVEDTKQNEIIKTNTKNKAAYQPDNLVCEFCGKTFRQLSYLVNHKQQHKRENLKKAQNVESVCNKSIFCCEVCKKEFRKLHHLVQHRIIIHKPNSISTRLLRKSSNEKHELSTVRDDKIVKRNEDQSAGFRCEPCDKSFRKLHHLVEHRETHDGINKKSSSTNNQTAGDGVKSTQYVCKICKKTFKKLQHLMEHNDQHLDSGSEKSDDKSVKSSLSTKDIIHECSLCYMVFPNEHSLNKHTIICLRKKKQAAKKAKLQEKKEKNGEEIINCDDNLSENEKRNISDKDDDSDTELEEDNDDISLDNNLEQKLEDKKELSREITLNQSKIEVHVTKKNDDVIPKKDEVSHLKRSIPEEEKPVVKAFEIVGKKIKKIRKIEVITIPDTPTPEKKISKTKTKLTAAMRKRNKSDNTDAITVKSEKITTDSSDDDEIRYMLNPNLKEDTVEVKFMKVRSNKRNSLQFERPNSKNLMKRRISLQNLPRLQRNKVKPVECKSTKTIEKSSTGSVKQTHSDSDDSDIKYSFPKINLQGESKEKVKMVKRQSITGKGQSVTSIPKGKSLEKAKLSITIPKNKRRTIEPEHRCDCGQLFSSAALLARHTTLAHTPPRVRRRRDPPPDQPARALPARTLPLAQANRADEGRKTVTAQPKVNRIHNKKNKSDATSNKVNTIKASRKTSVASSEIKTSQNKLVTSEPNVKKLRSATHKSVPLLDKMRKFVERAK